MKKTLIITLTLLILVAIALGAYLLAKIQPEKQPPVQKEVVTAPPIPSVSIAPEEYEQMYKAEMQLMADYKISLSTDSIRKFIQQNIDIKPWAFPAQQKFGRKLLAACEEVVLQGKKPVEVAERYTENFDDFRFWFSILSSITKEDIETMRSRLYPSYDAMIESLIPEWRDLAEKKALADAILPASESASVTWDEYLNKYLLNYSKKQENK